jgi:hypothetical protein
VSGFILDANTTIQCPHGGTVTTKPGKTQVTLAGNAVYVLDDFPAPVPAISGCSFVVATVPSPCMFLQWQAPATKVQVGRSPVLLSSSVALCLNAAQVPQGSALVSGFQTKAQAT